jgi:hypothetical protein
MNGASHPFNDIFLFPFKARVTSFPVLLESFFTTRLLSAHGEEEWGEKQRKTG